MSRFLMKRLCALVVASRLVAGESSVPRQKLVEVFEVESRARSSWASIGFATASGEVVGMGPGEENRAPDGWEWTTDWILDGSYGGDDGWEYSRAREDWRAVRRLKARLRRRRWVRVLTPSSKEPPKVAKPKPPQVASVFRRRLAALAALAREDFTFRGFGLGVSAAAFGWPKTTSRRTAGLVISCPITPNFASWERRSTYLPMVNLLLIAYPPSADAAVVAVVILSVSYPLDAIRRGWESCARPFFRIRRRSTEEQKQQLRLGKRSVQRVGFSVASRVRVGPRSLLNLHVSAVQLRPWVMYAPGLRLLGVLLDAVVLALAQRLDPVDDAATSPSTLDDAPGTNTATTTTNASKSNATITLNASTAQTRVAITARRLRALNRRRPTGPLARGLDAFRTAKAWWDSKTSFLGYSFLPLEADLYTDHERQQQQQQSPPFRLWRGSVIFTMRPFFPGFPKSAWPLRRVASSPQGSR